MSSRSPTRHGAPTVREPRVTKVEAMLTEKEGRALERARARLEKDGSKVTRSDFIRVVLREHLGLA